MRNFNLFTIVLSISLLYVNAYAIEFTEEFDWNWQQGMSSAQGFCTFGSDCWQLTGCGNGQNMFIRKSTSTEEASCTFQESNAVIGTSSSFHGGNGAGAPFIISTSPSRQNSSGAAEIITSRDNFRTRDGFMEVDLYLHNDMIPLGSLYHFVVMSNLQIGDRYVDGCISECPGVQDTTLALNIQGDDERAFFALIFVSFEVMILSKAPELVSFLKIPATQPLLASPLILTSFLIIHF